MQILPASSLLNAFTVLQSFQNSYDNGLNQYLQTKEGKQFLDTYINGIDNDNFKVTEKLNLKHYTEKIEQKRNNLPVLATIIGRFLHV